MIESNSLPIGFGMSLAMDLPAMTNFANLSEAKKEELVSYIEASKTGDEAKYRVKEVVRNLHDGQMF